MIYGVVKRFFDRKIYSADDVGQFVKSDKLTPEQYKQITGQEYEVIR